MFEYIVGELYNKERTGWVEGLVYQFRAGAHDLLIFLKSPTKSEVESVRSGNAEFAVLVDQPVIWFLAKFLPGLPWSDSPFSIHLVVHPAERLAADREALPNLLNITLVDANTGVIKALRSIGMSKEISTAIADAVDEQLAAGYPAQRAYGAAIDAAYARYPTTDKMAAAARVRYAAGSPE